MKHNIIKPITLILISLLFVHCDDDDSAIDSSAPEIIINSPANGDTLHIGEEVHFECDFTDNEELKSYKIEFHNNFNGHSHNSVQLKSEELEAWSYSNSWDFDTGLKSTTVHHHEIAIPESVASGEYHMGIYCVDAAGIESHIYVEVLLSNEEASDKDHDH